RMRFAKSAFSSSSLADIRAPSFAERPRSPAGAARGLTPRNQRMPPRSGGADGSACLRGSRPSPVVLAPDRIQRRSRAQWELDRHELGHVRLVRVDLDARL